MSLQLLTLTVASVGFAIVGLIYDNDAAYFMCAALVSVILVSFLSSRLSARALDWRREVADRVFEKEPFPVTLEVTNHGRLPLFFLRVSDTLARIRAGPGQPALHALRPVARETRDARLPGRPRSKRGVFTLGPLLVAVSDPFGVFQRAHPVEMSRARPSCGRVRCPLQAELEQEGADLQRPRFRRPVPRLGFRASSSTAIRDYQPGR